MEHILNLLKRTASPRSSSPCNIWPAPSKTTSATAAQLGMRISYSREEIPLGTAGSVKNAEELLDEPFMVISGDALTDFDLSNTSGSTEKKVDGHADPRPCANPLEYGVIITDDDGHISQFLEKPSWGEVFSDTINTGIYVLDPRSSTTSRKTSPSTSARNSSR